MKSKLLKKGKNILIPLGSNVAFNYVFRQKEVLIPFLSDLMHKEIKDLVYLDTELEPDTLFSKECRLDIRVQLVDKTYVNVEMQKTDKGNIILRLNYYAAENIYRQIKRGGDYEEIEKVVGASLIEYKDERFPKFHYIYKLTDELGLNKLKNKIYNKEEIRKEDIQISVDESIEIHIVNLLSEINNDKRLYRWRDLFKKFESWDEMEYKDKELQKAVEELKRLNMNEKAVAAYDMEMKILRDKISEEGVARRKGHEQGLKEGIEQGIEQGKKQAAINFYNLGVSKEQICEGLKISIEELDNILGTADKQS